MEIPEYFANLLQSPGPATLSVIAKDGHIQSSVVCPDFDCDCVKINLLLGSPKEKNIRKQGKASILVMHRTNENIYISLRCELIKITQDAAIEHLNKITQRNMNVNEWYGDVEQADAKDKARCAAAYLRPIHAYYT